jgi:hypothetical protein
MNNVQKMKAALAGEIIVRTWWGCSGLSGPAFRTWFLDCLMGKINRDDRRRWRRLAPDFQTSLCRDARRLTDLQHRIIHRQFETDFFKRRFEHLLTTD